MKGWYIVVEVAHGEQAFGEEGESSAHGGLLSLLDWDASIVWILSHPKNDSGGIGSSSFRVEFDSENPS